MQYQYKDYLRNHVVPLGREKALKEFLEQEYKGMHHKKKNSYNSNSEDALTWSCFDLLRNLPLDKKRGVLKEIWEDAYEDEKHEKIKFPFSDNDEIKIEIGKTYTGSKTNESTEVDASIELPRVLVFFEAKLYSAMSMKTPVHPHDQIVRKLRIGLDNPYPFGDENYDFYFIFLDIAPLEKLICRKSKKEAEMPAKGFHDKWKSAWWFSYYKYGRNNSLKPLKDALKGIEGIPDARQVAKNMGWLTWADLFKDLLRGMI